MSGQPAPVTTSLTIRETELAVIALQALKNGKVDLDDDKFTQMAGYTSVNSARVCFANLRKKLNAATTSTYFVANGSAAATPKVATPRKPRAKAAPKAKDETTSTEKSPTKRKGTPLKEGTPKKRSKKEAAVKKEEGDEDVDAASDATKNDADENKE
ncbi:MAG: hypothetical protein Q9168_005980 [Polycauliona sp. 1 TL-2023]